MSKFLLGAAGLVAAAGLFLGVGGLGAASAADMPVKYKAPPPVPVPVVGGPQRLSKLAM